jgi:DNA-directed RNA polymerase specialized sigma24 family protein
MSPERFTSLLESARQGSEAAWQELYGGLAPAILGYLRANGAPDPEDILSEVFLQVARDIARFDGDERGFRSWVFTIAHHRLIDVEEVQRVLEAISEDQRAVLLLRVIGDLSIEDVAKAVGKRPGAVKALQRRGLAAVKRELGRKGVVPL